MPTLTAPMTSKAPRARRPALSCDIPDLDAIDDAEELIRFAAALEGVALFARHRAEILQDPTSAAAGWSAGRLGQIKAFLPRWARW